MEAIAETLEPLRTTGPALPIAAEDVKVGQHVTVLTRRQSGDRSYVGDVCKVLAVCPPFVAVQVRPGLVASCSTYRTSLDTRCVELALLSDEYVEAMKSVP
jgi:hypothetical protein